MRKRYPLSIQKMLCAILLLQLYCSCEEPREIKAPYEPRLVVHGYVQTGQFFEITVGRTLPVEGDIPSYNTIYTADAIVVLYENDIRKDTLHFYWADRKYISTAAKALPGNRYRITVELAGFPKAEATATAPAVLPNLSVSRVKNARADANGAILDDVTFRFTDPVAETNYYRVELKGTNAYELYSFCVYTYEPAIEQFQGGLSPFESGNCIDNTNVLFTDASFNGLTREITISGVSEFLQEVVDNNGIRRPVLKKYSISAEYYRYIKDAIAQNLLQDNPFAQAFNLKGNVKSGYGLFTVFSMVADTLR